MKRIINLRCFLVVAIYVILAIFFALLSLSNIAGFILFYVLLGSAIGFFILGTFLSDKKILRFTFVLSFLFSIVAFVNFTVTFQNWSVRIIKDETYAITGVVESDTSKMQAADFFILKRVTIDGKKVSGKLQLNLSDYAPEVSLVRAGYKVSVHAKLNQFSLIDENGKVDGTVFRKNIRYGVYAPVSTVKFTPDGAGWQSRFLEDIYETLTISMGADYGGVAYSMLTGDKNYLDESISDYFSASGLGHIMAVSGLHIGFLVLILMFLCRKLHVPRVISIVIVSGILWFYAFLVGFSPSVLRAVVMCTIGLITFVNGKRNDILSALCFAVAVILCAAPFFLFECGFVLSVSAVFGLLVFAKPFENALRKIRIPKKIAAPVAVSAAVQLGIIPAMGFFFNQLLLYAFFLNIFAIPLIMVTYIAVLITLPFAMIFPPLTILVQIAGIGIAIISTMAEFVALLPYSRVIMPSFLGLFACYGCYFVAGRFFMLPRFKRIVSGVMALTCCCILGFPFLANNYRLSDLHNTVIAVDGNHDVTSVLIADDGSTYLVGDVLSAYFVREALLPKGITHIDAIYLFELNEKAAIQVAKLSGIFDVDKIYCPESGIAEGVATLIDYRITNFYSFESEERHNGFSTVAVNGKSVAYRYAQEDVSLLFMRYSSRYTAVPLETINKCSVIRSYMFLGKFPERFYLTNMPANYLEISGALYQKSVEELTNKTFNYKNGKISQYI